MYAEISTNAPELFTYKIPKSLLPKIKIGQLVKISLGKRINQGIVFEITKKKPRFRTKDILEIIHPEPLLSSYQVKLANWLSLYYFSSIYQSLKNIKIDGLEKSLENQPLKPKRFYTPVYKSKKDYKYKRFIFFGGNELYPKIASKFLKNKKQVLILFPDNFSLEKFLNNNLFKSKKTSVITSNLASKERIKEWFRIKNEESKLILGTRTAIFSPFKNLGLIILDKEYEDGYKQEKTPKYDSKEVAEFLQELTNCTLVLQTDIPTLENYYRLKNEYRILKSKLSKKQTKIIIDAEPLKFSVLGSKTESLIRKNLEEKKQTILFLNRKGREIFVSCTDCGFSPTCPNCEVPFTTTANYLVCNHCGHKEEIHLTCRKCQSPLIKKIGIGTEKLEEEVKKIFPEKRIERIDETTRKTLNPIRNPPIVNGGSRQWRLISNGVNRKKIEQADIIIGTQMIKGLDFKNTGLLVFFSIDNMLNLPSYKALENAQKIISSLISKLPERAHVVIKTSNPESELIQTIKKSDYLSFFEKEFKNRKKFHYPPFFDLISIIFPEEKQKEVKKELKSIKNYEIIGPFKPFLPKGRGKNRKIIVLKTSKNSFFYDKISKIKKISITRNPESII